MKTLLLLIGLAIASTAFAQSDPPVKMSATGICHAQGSAYYNQTKKFTAYKTIDERLKAEGRMPKK